MRFLILFCYIFFSCSFYGFEIDEDLEFDLFIEEKQETISDPFENVNRVIFKFNAALDKVILYPIAKGYSNLKSESISIFIKQFLDNLNEPSNFINAILQKKTELAVNAFWRFLINLTLGLGGVFEIAEPLGIKKNRLSFEDTMIFYGVEDGPYVVLPFQQPSSLRHAFASVLEMFVRPIFYIIENVIVSVAVNLALLIPCREEVLNIDIDSGVDSYSKWRSIFSQRKNYEINYS